MPDEQPPQSCVPPQPSSPGPHATPWLAQLFFAQQLPPLQTEPSGQPPQSIVPPQPSEWRPQSSGGQIAGLQHWFAIWPPQRIPVGQPPQSIVPPQPSF